MEEIITNVKDYLESLKSKPEVSGSDTVSNNFWNAANSFVRELEHIRNVKDLKEKSDTFYLEKLKKCLTWSHGGLGDYLRERGVAEETVGKFERDEIEEQHILHLTIDLLTIRGVSNNDCSRVRELFDELLSHEKKAQPMKQQVSKDPIYGIIEVNPLCQAIIETPIFQRLKHIKQLEMVGYSQPGAGHSRFEHSLGVYHLAGQFVRTLQQKQTELNITEKDILCVEVAALCHDIGRWPFSHAFERLFLPAICEKNERKKKKEVIKTLANENRLSMSLETKINKWDFKRIDINKEIDDLLKEIRETQAINHQQEDELKVTLHKITAEFKSDDLRIKTHNEIAVQLIDVLNEEVKFIDYGLDEKDVTFIKEMIAGPLEITGTQCYPFEGRDEEKAYLYDIVRNNRNSSDVRFWDYLARDCYRLGLKTNFDYSGFMKFATVLEENGELQICIIDKEIDNLYSMFYTRHKLEKAYQHETNLAMAIMVKDVLMNANDVVLLEGENGCMVKISECANEKDLKAFTTLNDIILYTILHYKDNDLSEKAKVKLARAKTVIERIFKKKFYTCVWRSPTLSLGYLKKEPLFSLEEALKHSLIKEDHLDPKDYVVTLRDLDRGMEEKKPVEKFKVYSKESQNKARFFTKAESSILMGPAIFNEIILRVYLVNHDEQKSKKLQEQCDLWYEGWSRQQLATFEAAEISNFQRNPENVLKGNQDSIKGFEQKADMDKRLTLTKGRHGQKADKTYVLSTLCPVGLLAVCLMAVGLMSCRPYVLSALCPINCYLI